MRNILLAPMAAFTLTLTAATPSVPSPNYTYYKVADATTQPAAPCNGDAVVVRCAGATTWNKVPAGEIWLPCGKGKALQYTNLLDSDDHHAEVTNNCPTTVAAGAFEGYNYYQMHITVNGEVPNACNFGDGDSSVLPFTLQTECQYYEDGVRLWW